MKKIILIVSIISVLLLAGCNKNQDVNNNEIGSGENQEDIQNTNNSGETNDNDNEATISLKYTTLENLKEQNLIPSKIENSEEYDVGSVKIGNNIYAVKYIVTTAEDSENESGIVEVEKLKFYDGDTEKLELIVGTESSYADYIKELTLFKDKYLVGVTNTNEGNSLQFIEIYDENLNKVKIVDENSDYDEIEVNKSYENYYSVNENDITLIRTRNGKKVTLSVTEVDGNLEATVVDETTDGVIEYSRKSLIKN